MPTTHEREYLSFGDSLFLFLERNGTPLNIASLATFDGAISAMDLRTLVASKLHLIPRYMQRVVIPPMNVGLPYWEFARDFRLDRHIREIELQHGTMTELKKVTADVLSLTMDRSHPLWDMTLIRGLRNNRTAMIARIHHCLADGISGMSLLNALMDSSPDAPAFKRRRIPVPPAGRSNEGTDIVNSAMQSWFSILERLLQSGSEVLTLVQHTTGISGAGSSEPTTGANGSPKLRPEDIMRVATSLADLPERLPFNVLCRGPQRFEWTEVSLENLKALRKACGATVNDAILTVLTAGFRRYSELHGVQSRGRSIRIVVPISTRKHHSDGLGNHLTFAPLSAPLGLRNPKKLLHAIHQQMEFVKTAHVAELVSFFGTLLGIIPAPLQATLAPLVSELPISLCNVICTNVPGPKQPLYLLGHEMLSAYPYVPIGGEMGINCAVLSYNGTVYFGFTGDVHAAPDLEKLPKFVDQSVNELLTAAGIHRTRSRRKRVSAAMKAPADIRLPAVEPKPAEKAAAVGATTSAA